MKLSRECMLTDIWKLLPKFMAKVFVNSKLPDAGSWALQVMYEGREDVEYDYRKMALNKQDIVSHFEQKPFHAYGFPRWNEGVKTARREASIGVRPAYQNRAKFFCMDVDYEPSMEALEQKILPAFKQHNIEYIYEYAGVDGERAHVWFFCDVDIALLKAFINKILKDAGVDWRALKLELYPSHKPKNVIRLLGGYHMRADKAHAILFRGKEGSDACFVMQSVIDCTPVTAEYMIEVVGSDLEEGVELDPKGILKKKTSLTVE